MRSGPGIPTVHSCRGHFLLSDPEDFRGGFAPAASDDEVPMRWYRWILIDPPSVALLDPAPSMREPLLSSLAVRSGRSPPFLPVAFGTLASRLSAVEKPEPWRIQPRRPDCALPPQSGQVVRVNHGWIALPRIGGRSPGRRSRR